MTELVVVVDDQNHRWTLNRPDRRNAIGNQLMGELLHAVESARTSACRLVVLDATPPAFCAGSDLKELATSTTEAIIALESDWSRLAASLRTLDCPVLAVVRGPAIGGGLFLAAFADYRLVARDAIFAAPEVALGWLPPGGIEELIELVGVGRARSIVMTGQPFDGDRAYQIGFADRVVDMDDMDDARSQVERDLLDLPGRAIVELKRYFRDRRDIGHENRERAQLDAFVRGLDTAEARSAIDRSIKPGGIKGAASHGRSAVGD